MAQLKLFRTCYSYRELPRTSAEYYFFEKDFFVCDGEQLIPVIAFTGYGGELLRDYWNINDLQSIAEKGLKLPKGMSPRKTVALQNRVKSIAQRSFNAIKAMLNQTQPNQSDRKLDGLHYYTETRIRAHFGMRVAQSLLSHRYCLTSLLDPLLLKLCEPSDGNHPLLSNALILTRYHNHLVSIPFENGRSIPDETIQLAQELNKRFPRKIQSMGSKQDGKDIPAQQTPQPESRNTNIPAPTGNQSPMREQLVQAYESLTVRRLFKEIFGSPASIWGNPNLDKRHPDANKFAAVAIAKAHNDVKQGADAPKDFAAFINACCLETRSKNGILESSVTFLHTCRTAFIKRAKTVFQRLTQD